MHSESKNDTWTDRPGSAGSFRQSIPIILKRCLSVYLYICLSFIAARWDGLIGTNLIYSESSGPNLKPREKKFPKKFKKRGDNSEKCVQSQKIDTWDGRIGTNLIYSESSGSWERPRQKKFSKFQFLKKFKKRGHNSKKLSSIKKTTRGRTDPAAPGLSASLYL